MKKEEKLAEQYATLHGWEKVEGVRFELSDTESDWEYLYLGKEELKSRAPDCTFWQYTEEEENVYEDVWDVIQYIEEHMEVPTFEDYKKSLKPSSLIEQRRKGK